MKSQIQNRPSSQERDTIYQNYKAMQTVNQNRLRDNCEDPSHFSLAKVTRTLHHLHKEGQTDTAEVYMLRELALDRLEEALGSRVGEVFRPDELLNGKKLSRSQHLKYTAPHLMHPRRYLWKDGEPAYMLTHCPRRRWHRLQAELEALGFSVIQFPCFDNPSRNFRQVVIGKTGTIDRGMLGYRPEKEQTGSISGCGDTNRQRAVRESRQ